MMKFVKGLFRSRRETKQTRSDNEGPLGRKKTPTSPNRPLDDAFREYINNEIPTRFIDTSTLQFIPRKDVFHCFQDAIANVTETHIRERFDKLNVEHGLTTNKYDVANRQIYREVVKYGILSHRWGNEADEPTFQDMANPGRKHHVSRFPKLAGFCKTAARLGCRLVWVDTCCIDETNPAERSEAVHAMFKWYANSHVCIAFLGEATSDKDWDNDSWFTRGWTLQELLAPRQVKFYLKDWQPLGSADIQDDRKHDMITPRLANITGVSSEILTADSDRQDVWGYRVWECSFWEVMSWASKRKTTRTEDRAYCLIGLFHVSLPIAYGEGQRAFFRLIEAIVARNPSWDVFAWFGKPSEDHFAIPPSPASYPNFEPDLMESRAGVREFKLTAHELSLKSLPPILMELRSFESPKAPGNHYLAYLGQRGCNEHSIGRFGDLVVECGVTRLKTIHDAGQLSVCIVNHHDSGSWRQGKLVIGKEYVCILLYRNHGEDGGTWMKLATENLLRISYLEAMETTVDDSAIRPVDVPDCADSTGITLPLVTTLIK